MIVTAWNNGTHSSTGAGYGLRVSVDDRDKYFKEDWSCVFLNLPDSISSIEVNIDKPSFWGKTCRELIEKEIGLWLRSNGLAPWPKNNPPKFELVSKDGNSFELKIYHS